LNKALGSAEALRFLVLFHHKPTDYVEISKKLYEGQTLEEIIKRAKSIGKRSIGKVEPNSDLLPTLSKRSLILLSLFQPRARARPPGRETAAPCTDL
jgi:hypothetical protein